MTTARLGMRRIDHAIAGRASANAQRVRAFLRDVAGRNGPQLVSILVAHVECAVEGVTFAEHVVARADPAGQEVETAMRAIERRGDALRRRLVSVLSETLVTPLDREDLFRVSRSIDDVLDNTRDFVREWTLYGPASARNLGAVLATLRDGLGALSGAVGALATSPDRVSGALLGAKQQAGEIRRHFQREVAALFHDPVDVELLKHRELLRRLDVVGLRFGEAVDVLFDALVKRGEGFFEQPDER
ncbi:MAG: DUF47 family protein [Actinomycetota bacterium]|nr:DUF47 family protein [Actinomycetota bacterium]